MNGRPARRAMSRSASAMSTAWASLSMTQGPATSTSDPRPPMLTPPASMISGGSTRLPYHGRRRRMPRREPVTMARVDESGEQRVRLERLRLEFRGELHRHIVGVGGQLDDPDELPVPRPADDLQPPFRPRLPLEAVEPLR